jgi:pyruvate,water dikinase
MPLPSLATIRRADSARCGCKAAALGELHALGYQVPPSVVVPIEVGQALARAARLDALIEARLAESVTAAPARLLEIEGELAAAWAPLRLPARLREELARWTAASGSGTFAVRSSGTHEDLPGATFAGQYASFLDVDADAVPAAVLGCFASLFSARAAMYRRRKGITEPGAMAVLIQPMIHGDHAGVVFTQAPRRTALLVVECTPGCGEGVVSGTASTNRYYLDRSTLAVVEARERVPVDRADIVALARLGLAIEASFGAPQDIEYTARGRDVHVLQARPLPLA